MVSHSIVIYGLSILLSILGGLIIVNNWVAITTDAVAQDTVRDLKLQAAVPGSGEFVISWTAPGDDPGTGKGRCNNIFGHFVNCGITLYT